MFLEMSRIDSVGKHRGACTILFSNFKIGWQQIFLHIEDTFQRSHLIRVLSNLQISCNKGGPALIGMWGG